MSEIEAVDLDTKRVHIPRPERYWMATAELFPAMIDPDLHDGRQRPADRDGIRWNEIGRMVTGIRLARPDGKCRRETQIHQAGPLNANTTFR